MTDEQHARYLAALHQVQTGIAFFEGRVAAGLDDRYAELEPKHLRTGIDSAHVSIDALYRTLVAAGVITEEQHAGELVASAEREAAAALARVQQVNPAITAIV